MRVSITSMIAMLLLVVAACKGVNEDQIPAPEKKLMTASAILSNPEYLSISYGAYRDTTRDIQPTVKQIKDDLKILSAMGIRILRTYNMQLPHASNVVKAIAELKKEQPSFEMYVMLGAWIDCKNAWTGMEPDHNVESEFNEAEIDRAVALTKQYPEIIKVIAVGNEAMVKWATSYYVQPDVILKWVNHLQDLKKEGELDKNLWITSSDNFASWGGGEGVYHVPELNELIKAVDYISMHTYPMHDTHYNPVFWGVSATNMLLSKEQKVENAMIRSVNYAKDQYNRVRDYMTSIGVDKPIHIGETGWATYANDLYGDEGSHAADQFKSGRFYHLMRKWTTQNNISCFYFEAFDENWKDAGNPQGSENHFGLFNIDGEAKYAMWELVDKGVFDGLSRNGNPITKSFDGDKKKLMSHVKLPPVKINFRGYE
ncbi:Exo-beta-1,3-glucanase, GH17 family [Nonlabens sp. Hel1_33_55]|uniref:glycosyl hydrolase family 17 protein n=1 Tax=Nonlabens sp. Hel1_33_55 TaxID=1336802 RepID=UPI000875C9C3|nr:glycosyl hydrolase family 17 protein [Nonlabens sp. Hel1_33_55]SCY20797.1 Exo-beta-1,3-glucanase, GH17 family [Nonlabens sp. Hel1_33_55]